MQITGGSALSKDEIDKMMRDAEAHADEDRQRREEVEIRNTGESLVYSTEKFIKENEDKLPEDTRGEVELALAELKTTLEGNDMDAIKAATEKAATASQALGAAMYAQNASAGSAEEPEFVDDEAVVDAEIVDEDEDK